MLNLFTEEAQAAVELAQEEARQLGHAHVGTEHILLGLLAGGGAAAQALTSAGASRDLARPKVAEAVGRADEEQSDGLLSLTPRGKRALERAGRFAAQRGSDRVETEHVLLGVLDVEGTAAQVLRRLGVDVAALREVVGAHGRAAPAVSRPKTGGKAKGPLCASCGASLEETIAVRTLAAREGRKRVDFTVAYCTDCGSAIGGGPPVAT